MPSSNPISEVPAGFFSGLGNLEEFYFQEVPIGSTLINGSLEFLGAPISIIDIGRNSISTLESHAITGLESNTELDIRDNEIRELTEESFRPMLDLFSLVEGIINLHGNPVERDCSMAWIVLNPVFLESVLGICTDGTYFKIWIQTFLKTFVSGEILPWQAIIPLGLVPKRFQQ
ncbi:unnamed protein product [Darwinula stevensoni]|uniref:Uncharacterized protein n=1 Tax=Darwinula stevensoni TaxID=69355 RepID=A0A7R9AFQ9_9CRUS|nr:unnamed protein product [Darwinula stevensoni]CAG0903541.1 unnamed protein product [Darwinula stevensoni]